MPGLEISLFISLWWVIGYLAIGLLSTIYTLYAEHLFENYEVNIVKVILGSLVLAVIWPYSLPVTIIQRRNSKKSVVEYKRSLKEQYHD